MSTQLLPVRTGSYAHEYLQNDLIPFRNNIKSIAYEKRVFTP